MKRFLLLILISVSFPLQAESLHIAVASNFVTTLKKLLASFEQGEKVMVSSGSSGKLYAQIIQGAPYHLFLAADRQRPARLEQRGRIVPGSRRTYAIGQLVLVADPGLGIRADSFTAALAEGLGAEGFRYLAMANPELAPYGRAARETLQELGYWQSLRNRIVRGENISQSWHFLASGNAQLGLLARSQVRGRKYWPVAAHYHRPIEQQLVLLRKNALALEFLEFLRSNRGQRIIHEAGYILPTRQDRPW